MMQSRESFLVIKLDLTLNVLIANRGLGCGSFFLSSSFCNAKRRYSKTIIWEVVCFPWFDANFPDTPKTLLATKEALIYVPVVRCPLWHLTRQIDNRSTMKGNFWSLIHFVSTCIGCAPFQIKSLLSVLSLANVLGQCIKYLPVTNSSLALVNVFQS